MVIGAVLSWSYQYVDFRSNFHVAESVGRQHVKQSIALFSCELWPLATVLCGCCGRRCGPKPNANRTHTSTHPSTHNFQLRNFFLHFYVRHLHRHIRILPSVTHSSLYNISGCCVLRSVRDSETWVLKDLPNRKTTGVTNSPLVVMLVIDAQILVLHITKLLCKMWQVIDRLQVSD